MVVADAKEQVKWLNSFFAKARDSNALSPRTISIGKPIDWKIEENLINDNDDY